MNILQEYNPLTALRIIAGVFFIPHALGKFFDKAGPTTFFKAAGLPSALWWFVGLAILETIFAIGLIFNFYTSAVAWLAAIYLLVAAVASYKVSKGKWLWLAGGSEYGIFWCLLCVVIALAHRAR